MAINIEGGPSFNPHTLVSEVRLRNTGSERAVSVTFIGLIEPTSGPEIGGARGHLYYDQPETLRAPFTGSDGRFFFVPGNPVRCSIY